MGQGSKPAAGCGEAMNWEDGSEQVAATALEGRRGRRDGREASGEECFSNESGRDKERERESRAKGIEERYGNR
jgi:hypothetical protein